MASVLCCCTRLRRLLLCDALTPNASVGGTVTLDWLLAQLISFAVRLPLASHAGDPIHASYAAVYFSAPVKKAETTALEPVDFADVELAPLNKNNLRRLMHEDVLAYRPELRSPAAGSSLPEPASRTGGREAARDGSSRGSSSTMAGAHPPPPPNGAAAYGESSHTSGSSRVANGGSANTHAGMGGGGQQRERSSRSDREGRSSGMSGSSGRSSGATAGSSSTSGRNDARAAAHAAARVRSGGAVARHPFPTEG